MRRKNQKGNAMVEFALGAGILIPCLFGTFQFGYGFYTYNRIESAIADAARFASLRTYRCQTASDIAKVKEAVMNVAVYGRPYVYDAWDDDVTPRRLIRELTIDKVVVNYTLNSLNEPTEVTVRVNNVKIDAVFASFTLPNKPKVTFPFLGRYAPEESEP